MMARNVVLFLMLLCAALWSKGQSPLNERHFLDSLENILRTGKSDSISARANLDLSKYWALKDSLKSTTYLLHGKQLVKNSPYLQILYHYYAAYLIARTDLEKGEETYKKADALLQNYSTSEAYLFRAKSWYEYGIIQVKKDNYKVATDILLNKAIPLAEKAGNKAFVGTSYLLLANIFKNSGQYTQGEDYCLKAIPLLKRYDPGSGELVAAYITIAENYTLSGKNPKSRATLDEVRHMLTPYPESEHLLDYYAAEGLYYIITDQFKNALSSIDKGIAIAQKTKVPYKENRLLLQKYYASYYDKDFAKSREILTYLLKQPLMIKMSVNRLQLYHGMALTNEQLGKKAIAYDWMKRYSELSDSISKSKLKNDVSAMEIKFRYVEKQKEIDGLKAKNQQALLAAKNNHLINWLLGSVSLSLFIVAIFSLLYYRNNKKLLAQKELSYQQHLTEMEQQQQLQSSQAMLQGEEQERRRLARDLHDGLGGMLAGLKINLSGQLDTPPAEDQKVNLQKVIGQLDNSVTELRRIAHNMMPVNLLSFGLKTALKDLCETLMTKTTRIDFQAFEIDGPIPELAQLNIYRIVQEMLANAIRHAEATNIFLQCSRNGDIFLITQEDNGKGFDMNAIQIENGIGLSNIRNRVGFLKGKMDIESAIDNGTIINIELHVN
jgi:two-component system NarL family sensor kinase